MPDHPNRPKGNRNSRSQTTPTVARHSRHSRRLRTPIGSTLAKDSSQSTLPNTDQSTNEAAEARLGSALSRASTRDLTQLEVDFRASLVRAAAAHGAPAASNNGEQEQQGPAVARGRSARGSRGTTVPRGRSARGSRGTTVLRGRSARGSRGTTALRGRGGAAQIGPRHYEKVECAVSEGAQWRGGDEEGDA